MALVEQRYNPAIEGPTERLKTVVDTLAKQQALIDRLRGMLSLSMAVLSWYASRPDEELPHGFRARARDVLKAIREMI